MKLLVINPNSDLETQQCIEEKVKKLSFPNCDIDVVSLKTTPKLMGTYADAVQALPEMIKIITEGVEYDAFIDACHSDPNLSFLQELTKRPVVGIAEASMKIASMECNNFAIISPSPKSIPKKKKLAQSYGCDFYYQSAEVCEANDSESLCKAAERAVKRDHVEGIVLGCANYANADEYIEKQLGVKVFDGVACAIIIASGLASYNRYKSK